MKLTASPALCLSALILLASAADPPTANLGYVTYTGYTNETAQINYFYGIPYAQPPLGDLRWRAPRPIEASNNFTGKTVNASTPPPICYQAEPLSLAKAGPESFREAFGPEYYLQDLPQSEDCLVLNVKAPQNPDSDSLPVFVMLRMCFLHTKEKSNCQLIKGNIQTAEDIHWALRNSFLQAMQLCTRLMVRRPDR